VKIIQTSPNTVRLSSITTGKAFEVNNVVYMAGQTEHTASSVRHVTNLHTGVVAQMAVSTQVVVYPNATITLEPTGDQS